MTTFRLFFVPSKCGDFGAPYDAKFQPKKNMKRDLYLADNNLIIFSKCHNIMPFGDKVFLNFLGNFSIF
jgi:hypothetical protein